jgi:serine protease AprX
VPLAVVPAAALVLAATLLAPPAPAARPAERSAGKAGSGHVALPGKGDTDGDKIADDLEAALAVAGPGERVAVIVQGTTPAKAAVAATTLQVEHRFRTIPAFAGSVTTGQVAALAHLSGVTRIELNGVARALDESGNRDNGVNAARSAATTKDGALDGSGVGICMIDTGIDPNHEQLAGRVVGFKDWVNDRLDPYDDHGHGTHVAGIAAGRPTGPGNAAYGGVATGASLISAKVLASNGFGEDADVVSAIEWCAARDDVDVISMSLGSPGSDGSDAGSQAANAAVSAGKVVVVAAGNDGDAPGTITSPGVATDAITVGAGSDPSALAGSSDTDQGLYLAGFSGRGPTTNPAAPTKPDVVAPGINVVSAKAGTTSSYVTFSGTSMATPFVAGVVALGLEADPAATPAEVKQAIRSSAQDAGTAGPDNEWGWGLADARSFVAALGAATPGTAPWPAHQLVGGSVAANATADFPFTVTTGGQPLAVTLRTTNGVATCLLPVNGSCWYGYEWSPDIDAYLVNPSGSVVAMSRCMLEASNGNCGAPGRFETLGIASAAAGTWELRVESYAGAGSFQADVFGAVGASTPDPTPPVAPTGLSASATSASTISVGWTDASSDEEAFTLERCEGVGCTTFAELATLLAGTTSYADSGLAADTSYTYRVRASNAAGSSAWSDTATAVTQSPVVLPPSAPTLAAQPVSTSEIVLTWSDLADEQGYTLDRCQGAGCTSFVTVATLPAGNTSYADTGLDAGTTYTYRLQAFNTGGTSAWSNTASATTLVLTAPTAPTGLTATVASGRVTLGWTDTSANETGLRVLRCKGTKCTPTTVVATLAADVVTWTDLAVLPRATYRYRVQAYNSVGTGTSGIVSAKTPR